MHIRQLKLLATGVAAVALLGACSDPAEPSLESGQGRLTLHLTDAPFPLDSAESIDVFVVRVEARLATTTEDEAALAVEEASAESNGWVTIATPNASFNLLDLQGGVSIELGGALIDEGAYQSLRLVLDTEQSGVTLKGGLVLNGSSSPSILFPSAGQSGLKVTLDQPIQIVAGEETEVLIDFDAGESFVLRGNTILQNGLLFKPVISASLIAESEG
ncbi:MAG TPA: DUF4382 domain-containing protein [Gemmatimonadaceae bacterium]